MGEGWVRVISVRENPRLTNPFALSLSKNLSSFSTHTNMPRAAPRRCSATRRRCIAFIPTSIAPIFTTVSRWRRSPTTERKTPKAEPCAERPVIDMAEFGRDLLRRREAAGNPDLPRNSGNRRTLSKRALLKAIEDAGGKW
jgi:hypothetical protein